MFVQPKGGNKRVPRNVATTVPDEDSKLWPATACSWDVFWGTRLHQLDYLPAIIPPF